MMQGQVHDGMPASHEMILPQPQPMFSLFVCHPDGAIVIVIWADDH